MQLNRGKNKIRTEKVLLETEKGGKTESASTDSERSDFVCVKKFSSLIIERG
jgi:hypothetical protein